MSLIYRCSYHLPLQAIGGILFPPLVMTYGFRSLRELRQMPKTEEEHEEELEDELEEEEEEEKGTEAMDEDKNGVQLKYEGPKIICFS